jgi:hypothetical protein
LCLWVVRGWKVGELERAEKRDTQTRETPLTENNGRSEKQDRPATVSSASTTGVQDIQLWTPVSLARRMVAFKRV